MKNKAFASLCLAAALLFSVMTAAFAEEEAPQDTGQETVTEEEQSTPTPEPTAAETETAVTETEPTPTPEPESTVTEDQTDPEPEEETADPEEEDETETPAEDPEEPEADGDGEETTSVKIEWTITDVRVTENRGYTWDADNLEWVETDTYTAADGTAAFTFTNYGTAAVQANVSFEAAGSMTASATFDSNNGCTLQPAGTAVITAEVSVDAAQFAGMSASGVVGTYTASITAID